MSIVMPVYNVERYLPPCLDSILTQDFESWELIAVDDGSTDGSTATLERYAASEPRIRVVRQANAGQGPARNCAIRKARGEFLVFVDSDDVVPPGSLRYLVVKLRQSGSDFAVAGVRRLQGDESYRPSWTVIVHEHDRIGITIDDFPAAMADVVAHHRIFRRRFWTQRIGDFSPGVYEDHVPMVAAYLRGRFDLLSRVTYEWRLREEGTSTGQQKHDLANLRRRIEVKAEAHKLVRREASPAVEAAWVGRVLDIDFPPYVEQALRADATYRATLQAALAEYVALATPSAWTHVRVRQKVRTYLASRGAWDVLESAEAVFAELGSIPPTTVRHGSVFLTTSPAAAGSVPDGLLELGRSESRLQVCLASCEEVQPGTLRLTGWAVVRAIDLSQRTPTTQLALVEGTSGRRVDLAVRPAQTPEATAWVNWPHGSFDRAGFEVEVSLDGLHGGASSRWHLDARVEVDGVVRQGGVHHALAGSSASRAALKARRIEMGERVAIPGYHPEDGFGVTIELQG